MGITHRHANAGMTQDALKRQDITPVHHKVAGEGMAQDVGALAFRQCQPCPFHCSPESRDRGGSKAAPLFQVLRDRLV